MRPRRRPLTENVGDRQAVLRGIETRFWDDFRYRSLTTSWPVFVLGAAIAFLALNALFALAYFLGPEPVSNVPQGSFLHDLYFSIETIATVGYGDMHPQTHYGHVVASLEMFVGLFYAAVLTGLIFARFARPRARVLFADKIAIGTHDGEPALMLRMANERRNAISNASAKLWMIRAADADGAHFRAITELSLLRRESPVFRLSWTIFHRIDETSPMHGLSSQDLTKLSAAFVVIVDGFDESSAQMIRARREYGSTELRFGERYVDILETTDDGLTLDYGKFHDTEPQAS
ncbi:inward rectifier potassium channel [Rhizobiales bacterium GAS191]|jgi:inward rectifier potassium channel|nr:inward rectifier potassium channel [Rhizobiales bacterium GAS113]SED01783.1 inward rectifier potassium channel [Rhizobiales bacterium GAS191]